MTEFQEARVGQARGCWATRLGFLRVQGWGSRARA